MKDNIKKIDGELEKYHSSNARLDAMIGSLRTELDECQACLSFSDFCMHNIFKAVVAVIFNDVHAVATFFTLPCVVYDVVMFFMTAGKD